MTAESPRIGMRRSNRLTSAARIKSVYESGRRGSSAAVGCVARIDHDGPPRVAVVAGRKVGSAVERNRAKRRLRAAVTPLLPRMHRGSEAVLGATAQTNKVPFEELADSVTAVLAKTGVLNRA